MHIEHTNTRISGSKQQLSQSQQSIWMGQKLSPAAPLYNMAHTFELFGNISLPHFHKSFQLVIDHFDALRLVFGEDKNGLPYQVALEELNYESEFIDLEILNYSEPELDQLIDQKSQRQFELSEPLFESVLIKKGKDNFLWLLNAHHLIIDIASIQLIYSKTAHYYQKLQDGSTIRDEGRSFIDYLQYEQNFRINSSNKSYFDHWETKNKNLPTIAKLYGRSNENGSTDSVRIKIPFEQKQLDQILSLSKQETYRAISDDMSLFGIFSMLLFTYLYRVTKADSITVGSLTSNRPAQKFRNTAGLFIQLLPLNVPIDEEETFKTLHSKVRHSYLDLLKNAVPGAATPELNQGIGAVLNYIPTRFGTFGDTKAYMQWLDTGHIDKNHFVRLQVYNLNNKGLELHLDLNTSLLTTDQVKFASSHFKKITEAFLSDQERKIATVNLTGLEELNIIESIINPDHNQHDKRPVSLLEFLEVNAGTSPAITHEGQTLTYEELSIRSSQVANFLNEHGINRGDRVVVRLRRSIHFVVSMLGILKAGASYVPIPIDYPIERAKKIIENVRPSLIISEESDFDDDLDKSIPTINISAQPDFYSSYPQEFGITSIDPQDPAYIMYTSGSTGEPKGVIITHKSLLNYLLAAKNLYLGDRKAICPLFTSIGFDLTVTSLYLPLISGGCIHIYGEDDTGHDLSILKVVQNREINFIKLTPSHARLINSMDLSHLNIDRMIFGGEDLDAQLATSLQKKIGDKLQIYNEYGPTEATVGCIVKKFHLDESLTNSVPIGQTLANTQAYVLDKGLSPVPIGVPGELYVGGEGLAKGYWDRPKLTDTSFVQRPSNPSQLLYKSGDLVRLNNSGDLEYLGRIDQQLKVGGIRIEGTEIESLLALYPDIQQVVVDQYHQKEDRFSKPNQFCKKCGLPSNYPNIHFDENGICDLCSSFETYQKNVNHYFKDLEMLKVIMQDARARKRGKYDCMMLLSGGKDSSYALAQLVDLDLEVLAFTLDNGYISDEAKANIKTVVDALGVDHIYGSTQYMNEIFVDSLKRFSNVCNGCFKALYTLSTQKALDLGIPVIFTGLSRGQFFETRLTEELFRKKKFEIEDIDKIILDARKAYHRIPDAVSKYLNVSMYESDDVFDKVHFIDFYRYCDVSMNELMTYLRERLNWIRPADTGRSTNCLINDLGIFMHKKERGYHNYAFPYSWDVRMGHKKRDEAIDELNDEIDEKEIKDMLKEIGFPSDRDEVGPQKQLVAYYKSKNAISNEDLQAHLLKYLPPTVVPTNFVHVEEIPLSINGKVDLKALEALNERSVEDDVTYEPPESEIEEIIASIWCEVFQLDQVSIKHPFLTLGGNSLLAIRIISRINEQLHLNLSVTTVFQHDSIYKLSQHIESLIEKLIKQAQ